ncbi:hypothetical protein BY996DRAFT_3984737 [Phakopsora pachyrhizi]|nr:hypothetical protein BY996DRAFT_3984737 [Phakopsora pachyrhizi]
MMIYEILDFCIDVIILSIIKTLLSTSITDNFQHQQSINISNTHYNYQSSSTAITRLLKLRQIFLGSKKLNENNSTGLAPHLVKRIFTRLMRIVVKDHHSSKDRTYRLEDVPFLLRLSILGYERGLEEVDPFGCTQQESKNILVHESSNSLVLDDRLELELIRSPQLKLFGSCLTLLNLSGCSKLIDSDVIHLHSTLGKTLAGIILDFTSVTDTGLGHLSRAASQDYPLKSNSNLFLLNETNEDFNTLSLTEPFGKLAMISLKGLKLVTDRCALKLCRFTNLKVIDLSGTSCTSAFRTIINKNSPSNFKCAISEDETRLFSNYLTWSQKLHEVTRYRTIRRMTQSSEEDLNLAEDTQESRRIFTTSDTSDQLCHLFSFYCWPVIIVARR